MGTGRRRRGHLLNVLFLTSWYPTRELSYGGVFVREQAKAVRSAGHEVIVLHLAGPMHGSDGRFWTMEEELDPSLSEGIEAHHVYHRRIPVRGSSYPLYLWSAVRAYTKMLDRGFRPDVLHAHVYGAGVPAALLAGRTRTPFVLTEHFSGVALRSLGRVETKKAQYAYSHAGRILPVSRFLEAAIRNYGVNRPFEVVPNVVDTSVFFPPGCSPSMRAERRLLFVGNLEPMDLKGFATLLRALASLDRCKYGWQLDVIGDGSERMRHEESVAQLGLSGWVTFHGSQSKSAVARAMRRADLLVAPSRIETFGAVVAEALASGLPVVSTTVGGIPELVDERSGKLVPPHDPVALADGLGETLDKLGTFDGAAMAAEARNRFSLEVVGGRLAQIYRAVLTEAASGRPVSREAAL